MKKYAVFPGVVTSRNDGDRHFVTASQLMRLYKVKPEECVIVPTSNDREIHGLIALTPRFSGDYSLPK